MQKKDFNSSSNATKDGIYLIVIFILSLVFAFSFDFFEFIEENLKKYDKYEIDEFILSLKK